MKKIVLSIIIIILVLILSSCTQKEYYIDGDYIISIKTDKARYNPLDIVTYTIIIDTSKFETATLNLKLEVFAITKSITTMNETCQVTENINNQQTCTVNWVTPLEDYKGYLSTISLMDRDKVMDYTTIAVDVSSDWQQYPRYGYLSDYYGLDETEILHNIEYLNRFHINGIQYYDWQNKHHIPYLESETEWLDIANNYVSKEVIDNYINASHAFNMVSMNYNLIFGAFEDYLSDQVSSEWGLYKDTIGNSLDYHPLPNDWATSKIYLMNPNNDSWRAYILNQEEIVFDNFDFDGWHMDQLGSRGNTYNFNGSKVDLATSYSDFMNYMATELDVKIVFNIVDGFGMLDVLQNEAQEFVYTEIWSLETYRELANIIYLYQNVSNKSVVIAGYMNYGLSNQNDTFNTPGILLTNATIFANGATHIELGDHGLLSNEYFPNDNLKMNDELTTKLIYYYDFQVAYQEILMGDVLKTDYVVTSSTHTLSNNGQSDTIWTFTKATDDYEIIHLINLMNNDNDWKDYNGEKNEPDNQKDIKIKYYTDSSIESVSICSPDILKGISKELAFKTKSDASGTYIEFTIEQLQYWDMVIIQKK